MGSIHWGSLLIGALLAAALSHFLLKKKAAA